MSKRPRNWPRSRAWDSTSASPASSSLACSTSLRFNMIARSGSEAVVVSAPNRYMTRLGLFGSPRHPTVNRVGSTSVVTSSWRLVPTPLVLLTPLAGHLRLEGFRLHLEPFALEFAELGFGQGFEIRPWISSLWSRLTSRIASWMTPILRGSNSTKVTQQRLARVVLAVRLVEGSFQPTDPGLDTLPNRQVVVAGADEQGRQVLLSVAAQSPAKLADHDGQLGATHLSDRPHAGHGQHPVGPAFHRQEESRAQVTGSNPRSVY